MLPCRSSSGNLRAPCRNIGIPVMRDFYIFTDYLFREQHRFEVWHGWAGIRSRPYWMFYQGGRYLRLGLTIPLLVLPWLLRDRWSRFAMLTCGVFAVGLLMEPWMQPHYAAPVTCLVVMLCGPVAAASTALVLAWPASGAVARVFASGDHRGVLRAGIRAADANEVSAWQFERARILSELKADGRRHLVIVRYGPKHHPNHEWVYNEADIDGAKVVWAREMDLPQTHRLLEYFKDRQVWLADIDMDNIPQTLVPYPSVSP